MSFGGDTKSLVPGTWALTFCRPLLATIVINPSGVTKESAVHDGHLGVDSSLYGKSETMEPICLLLTC